MAAVTGEHAPRVSTREAIVQAAIGCFGELGISGTGMEDIAAATGTSRRTVYNHFESKHALVLEVLVYRAAGILDMLRTEIAFKAPTVDLIIDTALRNLELSLRDPIGRQLSSPTEGHVISKFLLDERMMQARRAFWAPLLQAASEQGEIRDDLDVDETVNWLMFLLYSLGSLGEDFGLTGDRLRPALERYFARGIANP